MKKKKPVKAKIAALFFVRALVVSGTIFLSSFFAMSGIELIFHKDLPLVHAIDKIDLSAFSRSYDLKNAADMAPNDYRYGSYGRPTTIKLSGRALRLNTTSALQGHNDWLVRANAMHTMIFDDPRQDAVGILFFYCKVAPQTISSSNHPPIGSNIFVDTEKEWRYVFRVSQAHTVPEQTPFIISDDEQKPKLIISCNDIHSKTNTIVEAELLSVQGEG